MLVVFACHSCVFSSSLCLRSPILCLLAMLVNLHWLAMVSCVVIMLVFAFCCRAFVCLSWLCLLARQFLCLFAMMVMFDCHTCDSRLPCVYDCQACFCLSCLLTCVCSLWLVVLSPCLCLRFVVVVVFACSPILCLFAMMVMFDCHTCVFSSSLCLRLPGMFLPAMLVNLRLFAMVSCVVTMLVLAFFLSCFCLLAVLVFNCYDGYVRLSCLFMLMIACHACRAFL